MITRQIFFSVIFAVFCLPSVSFGQADGPVLPPDVRLVIDVSGSMKQNDPQNLRQPAVDLLVQLLPDNSKAGIWTFGRWVNMLVKHKKVDFDWREDAQSKSDEINSVGLFTNIGEALEKAAYDIKRENNPYRSSIILLTDGMVDIDKDPAVNRREWRRIVDEVLPKLVDAGVVVHTIALSKNADTDLLNKLSLTTDGIASVASSADDLMKIFLKAFEAAAPMEQVPLSEEGFVIDSSVEEFTALIFRKDRNASTQVVGPDQEVLTSASNSKYVNWYRADKYDLITVKQPLEGQWQVLTEMDPDSRITVVSNLNLRVRPLPNNILKGQQETVRFVLQEDGATIQRPEFLSLMDITANLTAGKDEFDLREIWDQPLETKNPPSDGVFSVALPVFEKEGIYQLSVTVDGKSFLREFNHQFTTRQPFGADIKQAFNDGRTEYVLTARAFDTDVVVTDTKIVATVISPDGRKKLRPLKPSGQDTWQATIRPQTEGEYIAKIKVRGANQDGGSFEQNIPAIRFNFSIDKGFVEEEEPFFEETPEPTATPEATAGPEPTAEPEPKVQAEAVVLEPDTGMPPWLLYAALGLANLVVFGLGFFLVKKILGGNKNDEILEQFSEETVEKELEAVVEEVEEEEEEEPPMEDLDPTEDIDPEPEVTETFEEPDDEDLDPGGAMDMPMDDELVEDEPETEPEPEPEPEMEMPIEDEALDDDDPMDALDDLDQMAVEAEEAPEEAAGESGDEEEEEEDMVTAMLKAQGLDLAEDELDDAISSLIDELENDDSFDGMDDDLPQE